MRRKAIIKLLAFTRMVGGDPAERMLIDSNIILRAWFHNKQSRLLEKSEIIAHDFLVKASRLFLLWDKLELVKTKGFIRNFANNFMEIVVNIQRKWRSLCTKKMFYKMLIRNMWKDSFSDIYTQLRQEKDRKSVV